MGHVSRKDIYTIGKPAGKHRLLPFKSLAWAIGTPLKIIRGVPFEGGEHPDGEVTIIADYGKTFLLKMEWIRTIWGKPMPPRYTYMLVPKASIACGDVQLQTLNEGIRITPDMVTDFGDAEYLGRED